MVRFSLNKYGLFKTDRWDVFYKKCRELGINPETVKAIPDENNEKIFSLTGKPIDNPVGESEVFGSCDKPLLKLKR